MHIRLISRDWLRQLPLLLFVAVLVAATLFSLISAYKGYPLYRDQHLGTAIAYSKGGFDLLRPKIVGFTATDTPVPQEFPLWQMVAGFFLKIGGGWWGWGSVASLLMFASCLLPFYRIGEWVGDEASVDASLCGKWSVAWLVAIPIVFYSAGEASVDAWAFATCIWFFYFSVSLLKSAHWGWLLSACFAGTLAATTKLPFFLACSVAIGFALVSTAARSSRSWLQLGLVGAVSAAGFLLWTKWCDSQLALAEFPYWELRLSHNPAMWQHYFGTLEYRLDLANWVKAGWRILGTLFGSFALAGIFIYALCTIRSRTLWSWILGCAAMLAVFTHLILVHRHYYIIFAPIVALAFGALLARIQTSGLSPLLNRTAFAVSVTVLIGLSTAQGLIVMEVPLKFDPYPDRIAKRVESHLPAHAMPIIQNGGWGGDIFMRMNRPGLSAHTSLSLKTPEQLSRLTSLGYTHLVMLAESPLLTAFQITNPGQADLARVGKYDETTPLIKEWKPIYEDDDIVIFKLPHSASQ